MPWDSDDVSGKTKKAKSPVAKRQWVHIANSALKGGASEGSAIRQANGVIAKRGHNNANVANNQPRSSTMNKRTY